MLVQADWKACMISSKSVPTKVKGKGKGRQFV